MSKYEKLGPYHFIDYVAKESVYYKHVEDLIFELQDHVGVGPYHCYEVGCGEGLILSQIQQRLKWRCRGSEIDAEAIRMAQRLNRNIGFDLSQEPDDYCPVDVALFADSLEHIDKPFLMLEWAKKATWIVIAVPSRKDPHSLRELKEDAFDNQLSAWGEIVHRATRCARHLTIWKHRA